MLQRQRLIGRIIILLLIIVIGAFSAFLTLTLSSPLDSSSVAPLLASGLLFILFVLFLSFWLSSFLHSSLLRPTLNYEQYGLARFVSAFPSGSGRTAGEGGRVPITVFYSNIHGFSAFIEQREDETVVRTLHQLLDMQTNLIRALNGEVKTYIGDKVVAMFSNRDAALDACKTALRVQHTLSGDSSNLFEGLQASIGIHTGEVIMGRPASSGSTDTAVIGDSFNAASRLCGAAAAGQILISRETYDLVGELVQVDGPYRLKAKGSEQYMTVYFLKEMLDETEE